MTTFDTAAETYLRHVTIERGLSPHTLAAYRRDLATFHGWLEATDPVDAVGPARAGGRLALDDIGTLARADVSGFVEHLVQRPEGALAPRSVARMLSSVRSFTAFLTAEGVLAADPAMTVTPPKAPMRLPKAITIAQMEALLAAVDGDDPVRLRDRALLELLYATGARISEAIGLSVDDIIALDSDSDSDAVADADVAPSADADASVDRNPDRDPDADDIAVVRVTGKGDKQRIVPIGRYARAAVDAYLVRARPMFAARGTGAHALFLGPRGAPMSRQSAWLVIQAAADRANLTAHVSPHTFRHSFATHLLEGGADVRVVQELLGHASVSTTQIYTMVTADMLRDVYQTAHPRARRA